MHHYTKRILLAATVLTGSTLAARSVSGAGEAPLPAIPIPGSPTAPTVPAPVPPTGQHVRFQYLVPNSGKVGDVEKPGNGDKNGVETGPELSLGECIAVAIDRHPALKAACASKQAAEDGYRSLLNFGSLGTLVSPDLTIRKQQAKRGLAAAASEYQKVYNEIVQDVTRLYYTAIYAKQQEEVVDGLIEKLEAYIEVSEVILRDTPPENLEGLSRAKVDTMKIGLLEAKGEQARAGAGRKQAKAALRQAMAVEECNFPFRIKDEELPLMAQQVPFTKELVIEHALCRRPEFALAAAGVDAFRLEVYAQGMLAFKRVVPTLASGADLHSKDIPQAVRGEEYRPGGILPEMPPVLVGSKFDRVTRARALSLRADAVYESARSLVSLEAENGFYLFELANERLRFAKARLDIALVMQKRARDNNPNTKAKDVLVQAEVIATKAQADYVKAVYQYLLELAALERITAGGINPAFPGR